MKILLVTERFAPSTGGVETVGRLLANALADQGHPITVLTRPGSAARLASGVRLVPARSAFRVVPQFLRADAVILQGPAIRLAWPLLFLPSKALLVHHAVPALTGQGGRLRRFLCRRCRQLTVSRAMAARLSLPAQGVVPNPYDTSAFWSAGTESRPRDIIFVGRLLPEKGARVLLEAIVLLRAQGLTPRVSIIGDGPERLDLARFARRTGLAPSIRFEGQVAGVALGNLLRQHKLMVAPSLHHEPFGIVALEAIACGCIVLGSHTGGLPEAIGKCGFTFPAGSAPALADLIRRCLARNFPAAQFAAQREGHLAPHLPEAVARHYLERLRRWVIPPLHATCNSATFRTAGNLTT